MSNKTFRALIVAIAAIGLLIAAIKFIQGVP